MVTTMNSAPFFTCFLAVSGIFCPIFCKLPYSLPKSPPLEDNYTKLSSAFCIKTINILNKKNTEFSIKEIKKLYDNIITNLANFLKEQNITDPVEIFAIYEFMYRNGYLKFKFTPTYNMTIGIFR